jgi:hypothetical protein
VGTPPDLKVKDGVVAIRYPQRLWVKGNERRAEVTLNTELPWQILIQGGPAAIIADLAKLDLDGLEVRGGLSTVSLLLPVPSRRVSVKLSGGASDITVLRPKWVSTRVHLKGWVSDFTFDDQFFTGIGNDMRLQSPGYDPNVPFYDIEVNSSASHVVITTG